MDVDSGSEKRRASMSLSDRSDSVLRELESDVRSMLPQQGGFLGFLRGWAEGEFGD